MHAHMCIKRCRYIYYSVAGATTVFLIILYRLAIMIGPLSVAITQLVACMHGHRVNSSPIYM